MSRPHLNKPNPAIQRLYRESEEAWGRQDYQKSISLVEQATRKDPRNPSLLLDLARAYGRRYDFPAAERCLEKAVEISKDRAHTSRRRGGFVWTSMTSAWPSATWRAPVRRRASPSAR